MLFPRRIAVALLVGWLGAHAAVADGDVVVVTTSLLEAAVADYAAALPNDVRVVSLIPPGSCPGHFDLSPRAVPVLREARLVLRHDFQQSLDAQLRKLGGEGVNVRGIAAQGSLLVPANYAALSADTASALALVWPERKDALATRRDEVAKEAAAFGERVLSGPRPWADAPVVASVQQKAFCSWLGLRVVGTLERPDDTSPRELAALLGVKAELVIGNLQSDAKAAEALAKRKGIPVVVFSNFPAAAENGYQALVAANLKELADAWQKRSQR
jgi:zinc transport system substrate-binding protein